jgi:hypothetical protein
MKNPKTTDDPHDEMQVYCLVGDQGHLWIGHYDTMPPAVRQRWRNSPFNVCAACAKAFVLSEVRAQFPKLSHEQALLKALEIMEVKIRKGDVAKMRRK